MSPQSKPFILVDGSSYLYRAFHALPALANSKGFPTGAIYGMINMLKRLMADYQPEYMTVIFDAKGKTFRQDLYEAYKATRHEMPNEMAQQIKPIHEIIKALGLPIIMVEGVEADDIIGTLCAELNSSNVDLLISTGDKDLAQLVNDKITLINTMTNFKLNPLTVKEKFGVTPEQIIDYLTLVGDTSDNIPGVPLVGPKTAAKWLNEFGSLDNIIAKANTIPGKAGENLRSVLNNLPLVKSLVTIKMDIKLPLKINELKLKSPDKPALIRYYKEMEFKAWLSELLNEVKDETKDHSKQYKVITDEKAFKDFYDELSKAKLFAISTETTLFQNRMANLVGLSIGLAPEKSFYIPLAHDYLEAPTQLSKAFVLKQLKPILENPHIKKVGHNLKYILEVFFHQDIYLQGIIFDSMMESYLLDSASNSHDINSLALKYLGWRRLSYEEIAGKGNKQIPFNHISLEKAGLYAAETTDLAWRLHNELWPRIQKEPGLKRVYEEIELPLIPVLARMEHAGVLVDAGELQKLEVIFTKRLQELEKEAYDIAQKSFNLNSPKQLQEILFQQLKLPIIQKTPTGQPSTADQVLQELAIEYPLPRLIIEYRSLSKLISTYTAPLVHQISGKSGRIHTSYNQTVTTTGRLSSSDPNLQNIPIRTAEGRKIRQAFIAGKGMQIIRADYSQIELRLMAHLSEDPGLIKAFQEGLDIHTATAAEVWGVNLENVTSEMRRNAKAINFGLIYGMSAFGLTRQLGIDRKAAQEYIDIYFARYPNVLAYMEKARATVKEKGYVETLWGRRLYIPDIHASQIPRQKAAERAAINAPLQGSAADIIKLAMIVIDRSIKTENIPAKMIMQVHDELVFEADQSQAEGIAKEIQRLMCTITTLKVPLTVTVGIGPNWDAADKST